MFITFEGIDGCGKTTQLELFEKFLTEKGIEVIVTRQPGGTTIGKDIRKILLDPKNSALCSESELLLYMADRIQHLREIVQPALKAGKIVLCDRYHDSTLAYQGNGRGLDLAWLAPLEKQFVLRPDLTIWFDLPLSVARNRMDQRGSKESRIDDEKLSFHQRVSEGYQKLFDSDQERFIKINADQTIEQMQTELLKKVTPKLTKKEFNLS